MEHEELKSLREILTRYHALLHYTDTKHSTLGDLVPLKVSNLSSRPCAVSSSKRPLLRSTLSIVSSLPGSALNLTLILPSLLLHAPGYLAGYLAGKIPPTGEEEAVAQYQGIGGGIGIGLGLLVGLKYGGWKCLALFSQWLVRKLLYLGTRAGILRLSDARRIWIEGKAKSPLAVVRFVYIGTWLLVKWHGFLVDSNYLQ